MQQWLIQEFSFMFLKNVVLEDIIESHFVQNNTVDEAFVKHVLIVAEENSLLSYVERFLSIGEP